jgi:C1A family cysteine protease
MEAHLPAPYNQVGTSSCTGQSSSGAIYTSWGAQGIKDRRIPSQLWLYDIGRAVTNTETVDEGTYIRDVFKAAKVLGVAPATVWPFVEAKVNERPDWATFRAAYDQRSLKGYYRINSVGAARILDIKRALAANHPIVYGLEIDAKWFDYKGGLLDESKVIIGGHAMFLYGHYKDEFFWGQNSWGPGWGEHGRYRIKQSAVANALASDLWVIDAPHDSGTK